MYVQYYVNTDMSGFSSFLKVVYISNINHDQYRLTISQWAEVFFDDDESHK